MSVNYLQSICYLDTNLLIYMFDARDQAKQKKANELYVHFLKSGLGRISVQVISEWRNAMVKKFGTLITGQYRREFMETLKAWNPISISSEFIISADRLSESYGFSPYDSIHIQCALESGCEYFLSEDMQNGLIIEGVLSILNPF